jgi:enoyl-CoA hydratase/carnithine racemase
VTWSTVRCEVDDRGRARIVLDRPRQLNAFDDTMLRELQECCSRLNDDPAVRVVAVSGAEGNFCSGRDRDELATVAARDSGRPLPSSGGHESSMFRALEMPTVALIDGVCVGGGLGFALQCDLRVATSRARFFDGHLVNGMAPSVASWYLPRITSAGAALRFLAAPEPIGADGAVALGLVDVVVDPGDLDAEFDRLVEPFLTADPALVRHTKALLRAAETGGYEDTMTQVGLLRAVERLRRR